MKIVDVAEFYAPNGGGVRTYIDQKMAAGAALGHEVVVIAPGAARTTELRNGGRIEWVPAQRLAADRNYRLFWNFSPVHEILDAERPDVVEASSPWTAPWIVAAWRGPAARALFLHADPVAIFPYRWFNGLLSHAQVDTLFFWFWAHLRALDRRFDRMIVSGTWLQQRMMRYGIREPAVAPLGVETGSFSPRLRDPALRRDLLARCGLPETAPLLIGVGRHHAEKRWPFLMRAVAAAAGRPIGFVIAGDGLMRARVEREATKHPHVHLLGHVGDRALLARMLASSDALLHGSGSETFGIVAAEAIASGTPLIVPDTGGVADLARPAHAETYATGVHAAAVAAIERFLLRDRVAMSAAAALAAEQVGTPTARFAQLFDIYRDLAADASAGRQPLIGAEPPLLEERRYRAA